MLSVSFLRWLFGVLRVRASGGFAARFLNLCDSMHLRVWDLRIDASGVSANVAPRDYRALRTAAKKAGMRLRCEEKRGLPFFLRRNRTRWGLLAGAVLCAGLAVWTSCFLWSVETTGAVQVPAADILAAAAQVGLYPGAKKPLKNGEDLAIDLQQAMNGALTWAAVNMIGGRVVIEVRDEQKQQTQPDPPFGAPCDLVADFDGLLLSLEVHSGEPANRVGNGVKKGDVLIKGTRTDREGKPYLYEARGVVTALHEDLRTLRFPAETTLQRTAAVRRVPVLRLWHLVLPLGIFPRGGNYTACTRTKNAVLNGVGLPFSLEVRTRYYWTKQTTDTAALAVDTFVQSLSEAYRNTRVLSGEVKAEMQNGVCTLTQRSRVIDFMGTRRPIAD